MQNHFNHIVHLKLHIFFCDFQCSHPVYTLISHVMCAALFPFICFLYLSTFLFFSTLSLLSLLSVRSMMAMIDDQCIVVAFYRSVFCVLTFQEKLHFVKATSMTSLVPCAIVLPSHRFGKGDSVAWSYSILMVGSIYAAIFLSCCLAQPRWFSSIRTIMFLRFLDSYLRSTLN